METGEAQPEVKITLRLAADLHARLKRVAQQERRSMHAQILLFVEDGVGRSEKERPSEAIEK